MGIYFQIHSFIQAHINYCSSLWGFTCKSTALSRHTSTTALHYGDLLQNFKSTALSRHTLTTALHYGDVLSTSKSTDLSRHTLTTALHYGDVLPNPQLYPGTHKLLLFVKGIYLKIHSFIQAHINYCYSLWGLTSKSTALSRHTLITALHYGD